MTRRDDGIYDALVRRGMSRRSFMKFATAMTAALALPATYAPRIAHAVATAPRVPVIWLRGQDCSGNTMSFLRSADPTVVELLLDLLSLDYHETLMASAGASADLARVATMEKYPNGYIAVVEGGIPTADDGVYCMIGGRPFRDVVREVTAGALATIAVGSCAFDGGLPAASGGPTGAVGVGQVASGGVVVNLPGCPMNVDNLAATIVHYLTWKQWPVTDSRQRPLFAYGGLIHNQCERRAHFEFGEFVLAWGDEASQKGWCLYKMGCKGPEAYANCPSQQFDSGTSWPVRAGAGCIGCTMPGFWDAMSPFYRRLQSPIPFAIAPNVSVDQVGAVLIGGVAALTIVHGTATFARERRTMASKGRAARKAAAAGATDATPVPATVPVAAVAVAPDELPGPLPPGPLPPATAPDAEVR
jgi:hydrogenase small subunit